MVLLVSMIITLTVWLIRILLLQALYQNARKNMSGHCCKIY